ncbi:MAG: N-acetylmuramoyl-L-alanine amidase [Rhodospirillales bacterium 20-60-12]|nr:MAG: N-acetylmuramoyl-L-alanine amidase [Rhodospirillales bacterium 20-60-12]HQT66489.1 N-acetylmuramoyl-L-alanine amidase [Acetobacteraceae bacterium]
MAFSRRFFLDAGVKATIMLPVWMRSGLARAAETGQRRLLSRPATRLADTDRLVVIDPGHGGHDPGCIGSGNLYEKNIALAAAYDLKDTLIRSGYDVVMTRATDIFIPLQTRVDIAERHKAAVFLSIHANSVSPNDVVRGASVYTFSDQASDALAAKIATSENSVEKLANPSFRGVSPDVAKILFSLMQHSTKLESRVLQQHMINALSKNVDMLNNPARHATFAVLQSSAIPSVLVETAFLSNPQDEAELRTPAFRTRIAESMKTAVDAWFLARKYALTNM